MANDIFDKLAAASKGGGDIFDRLAAKAPSPESQVPDATAQAQQATQTLAGKTIQYTPERKFEMNVAKGFGLDPQKLAEAEASGGNSAALMNIGGQALAGATKAVVGLPGAIGAVAKDPLRAITGPIDAMASNVVKPSGLPDTGSAFDTRGYSKPNPGQLMGALAGTEAIGGAGEKIISPLSKWLGASKSMGAKLLQRASGKVGNAPVELSAKTNELVDEIVREGKSGGTVPKVITDLLDRVGPSTRQAAEAAPGPLAYNEARSFQSNASQLSAAELMNLKGKMKSLVPQFAKSFGEDIQATATQGGAGTEHALGMKEFATASARNRVLVKAGKAAVAGAGLYGAEELIRKAVSGSKP